MIYNTYALFKNLRRDKGKTRISKGRNVNIEFRKEIIIIDEEEHI